MTGGISVKLTAAPGIELPSYQTPGSSGADVRASTTVTIPPRGWAAVPTGLSCEVPEGWEIQVRSRSGLALKEGLFVLNSPGTVDSDYRGEIKVILANLSDKEFSVKTGDRIAQLVLVKVERASFARADRLSGTERGGGGFGHTGT